MNPRPAAATPIDIPVRHMDLPLPADLPRHWANGEPWETHLFNALSMTFPVGERSFIDSVRAFVDRISDPQLLDDVRAFIGQEVQHSREHHAFNEWLASLGLPYREVQEFIEADIAKNQAGASDLQKLAVTCALEHFTALMAEAFLAHPELFDGVPEPLRTMWLWHAVEEAEHKSVAFDVFQHCGGDYPTRAVAMAMVTYRFLVNQSRFHRWLMRADGQTGNLRSTARGAWKYWGPRGVFTRLVPAYLAYYRPSFHPWERDDRELLARFRDLVEARAKRVQHQPRRGEARPAAA